jgi:signal transduction histidine kinase
MFNRLPRSVGGLALTVAGISCVLTLTVGVITFSTVHHEIERQLDHRIELETDSLLATYERTNFETLVRAVDDRVRRPQRGTIGYLSGVSDAGSGMAYLVLDAQGRRRAGDLDTPPPKPGWSEFVRFRRADGVMSVAQAMNSRLPDGGSLVVAADRAVLRQIDGGLMRLFLVNFGLVVGVGVLATLGFGSVVQRRLNAIHGAAEGIMAGDLSRRMPKDGSGGEFDQLASVLNRMLDRIGGLMDNLRQVSGDIAHDLRTPLTRLRARLEDAEEIATTPAQRGGLEGALREIDDLQSLLTSLMALSELEGRSVRDRFATLDLDAAIAELAEAYAPALDAAGMTLSLDLSPTRIWGERRLLQRAISNLLDNSLAHAGKGSNLTITLRSVGDRVALDVADDGRGVPVEARERIFQRFVRLDPSRSTPGHGLGLSLVSAIIAAHDGAIRVRPSERGLAFAIELPSFA